MNLLLIIILWYVVGLISVYYVFSETNDIVLGDLPILLFLSLGGPVVTLIAFFRSEIGNTVVFKKRKKE